MKWTQEEKIVRYTLFGSTSLLLILAVLLFILFFSFERRSHLQKLQDIEQTLLAKEKEFLQISVNEHIAHLKTRKEQVLEELKKILQKRVANASRVAHHIYTNGHAQGLAVEEIETRIREAIRPLRFNQKKSYFFIRSLDGTKQLYPPDPASEGENIKNSNNAIKLQVFQQAIDVVTTKGQGFIEYQWPKPGPDKETLYKKISYVSYFEPLDWYIGCGEYMTDFEEYIKNRLITVMNKPGWSNNNSSYIFILDRHDINDSDQLSSTMLVNSNRPDLIGKTIPDSFRDADGREFVKEYMEGIREDGEAVVTYRFKKPGSDTPQLKVSYLKLMPEWNWIVGQGIYLDDVERLIIKEKIEAISAKKKELVFFILLFGIALSCSLLLSLFFSRRLKAIFADYRDNKLHLQQKLQHQRDSLKEQVMQRTKELEQATDQLVHAEKISAIGRLSASIAHEFNNPLNGIRSVMEGLQLNTTLASEDSTLIDLALKECDRVKILIRQLLDFSSPSSGKQTAIVLNPLINEILAMVEKELTSSSIRVETVFTAQLPLLHTIPDQLKQVLLNLITNAKDAMQKDGGTLHIQTELVNEEIVVHVRDSGTGISPEIMSQIFEPFFTTKPAVKGTGLGLSVSYGIIKNLGGKIEVESVCGEGSTFSIILPLKERDP